MRLRREIVETDDRRAPPLVADPEYRMGAGRENLPASPADLRALLAEPDHAGHPAKQRVAVAPLLLDVHELWSVRALDERTDDLLRVREAAVLLRRPLHRRPDRRTLLQSNVLAHADLVAVAEHGRARQREHQAVGEPQEARIGEHRGGPAPDATVVEPHRRLRPEAIEDERTVGCREAGEVELIVAAEKVRPLRVGRNPLRCA